MKRHRHTLEQIVRKLREGERLLNEGKDITEVVRHLGIAESTWNRWRSQYGGMKADEAKRLRQLEGENARLKKLLAEAELAKPCSRSWPRKLLTPERRRRAVVVLTQRFGVSERRACRVTGQHRSTQRLVGRPRPAEEDKLRRRLRAIARAHPAGAGRPPIPSFAGRAGPSTASARGACGVRRACAGRPRAGASGAVHPVVASCCGRSARTRSGLWTSSSTRPPTAGG